jgi:prepilin-type N-terminal cleavage/methylation domain-containing protein
MENDSKLELRAFTLIELLVVIGVIAILAGIIIGVLPAARNKSVRGRVVTEMRAVETAIESYKVKFNFYPPSTFREGFPNSLFYELTGTTNGPDGYGSIFAPADPLLTAAQLKPLFGVEGFLNTAPAAEASDVPNFYKTMQPGQVQQMETNISGTIRYKVLVCGRRGMDGQMAVWRYSSTPTNNSSGFDLWAEIELAGKRIIIGNWEK